MREGPSDLISRYPRCLVCMTRALQGEKIDPSVTDWLRSSYSRAVELARRRAWPDVDSLAAVHLPGTYMGPLHADGKSRSGSVRLQRVLRRARSNRSSMTCSYACVSI